MKTYLLSAVVAGLFATSSAMAGDFSAMGAAAGTAMTEAKLGTVEGGRHNSGAAARALNNNQVNLVKQFAKSEINQSNSIGSAVFAKYPDDSGNIITRDVTQSNSASVSLTQSVTNTR